MAESIWGVDPEVGGRLLELGWAQDDEWLKQYLPAVARHGNAVVAMPPSPAWALPAMAAVISAIKASKGRALLLAAPAQVEQMGLVLNRLSAGSAVRVVTATGPARASRQISEGEVDLLVTSPATALTLHTRSALEIEKLTSVTLAWPETWASDEALTVLLGELGRESQRLVLTSSTLKVTELVQRHVRRSLTVEYPDAADSDSELAEPRSVRTLTTGWTGRDGAMTTLLEALDPRELAIWSADNSESDKLSAVSQELPSTEVVFGRTAEPTAGMVVCHDLPMPNDLKRLAAGRDLVLMVTPGTSGYAETFAVGARPIRQAGIIDSLRDRDATLRTQISAAVESGDLHAASYVIAPLLDRHDPQAIAAACFQLWRDAASGSEKAAESGKAPAESQKPTTPVGGVSNAKIWVGVGRRDEATPGDMVAVLIKEVGLTREAIGRIELRETFTLVEVPTEQAESVAKKLNGLTVRRRKLVARVDQGIPQGPRGGDRGRPGARGPQRHERPGSGHRGR